jgi:hypothetical protein
MTEAMTACIGAHETNGNNTNYITRWYGLNGQPWCNMTVTYAAWHSGCKESVTFGTKYAYTVAHAQKFKDKGQWHPMTNGVANSGIREGDIIFFDWSGGSGVGGIDHVGYVTGRSGSVVHTIEGNYGDVCARFNRTASVIAGFGRPKYVAVPGTTKPVPVGVEPFPGAAFFTGTPNSSLITRMGKRLVAEGCGTYATGPGPQWTDADKASYARFQRKIGYTGADANGWPGLDSWTKLRVPKA